MKKHKLLITLCAFFSVNFTSCSDLLTEKPDSFYEKDLYFSSTANAKMAVTGIYDVLAKLGHYGQFEMAMPASDDTYYINGTGTDNTRRDIAHYTIKTTNTWIESIWEFKYQGLDRANFAISGIENMSDYPNDKTLVALVAEARFLRALLAFDIIKYWGDAPFKTSYSSGYNEAFQPRQSREQIYEQIINDLNFAKENLEWGSASSSPEKANQGAARALLMRVLLQRCGYSLQMDGQMTRPEESKRTEYFNAIIKEWEAFNAKGYHRFYNKGYIELFKNFSAGTLNSEESIFEIAFYTPDGKAEDAGNWGTYNGPLVEAPGVKPTETSGYMGRANAFFRVVPEWRKFFEETDTRRDVMVCTYQYKWNKTLYNHQKVENPLGKDWYPGKWRREWMPKGYIDPNNVNANYCLIRYADVVLMAAEAYNEIGSTPTAWILLNSVRTRSGATAITASNYPTLLKAPRVYDLSFINDADDKGKFRTALYWERGFELAFEGQRKFDLIRWGIIKEALTLFGSNSEVNQNIADDKKPYPAYINFKNGKDELFPIPLSEIQSNPKLENKNNPSY